MPVYPPAYLQALISSGGLPLLALGISQTENFVAQGFIGETGDIVKNNLWTKEDGWKKSSVTYDLSHGTEYVVSIMEVGGIPEQYWSLKHCYIK